MSEVYVHGVVSSTTRVEVTAAPVRWVEHRGVAALVSDAGEGSRMASDALRRHWSVLEEVVATTTVLPVRFGTAMADEQAVVDDFLAPRHERLEASLARMAGKVQLSLKGEYEEGELLRGVVESSPAIARLRERVRAIPEAASYYDRIRLGEMIAGAVERAREADTALVLGRLEPLAVSTSREASSSVNSAVDAAFLVDRDRIDAFSECVAELDRELGPRVSLRYVGPLPPYSFAEEATAARGPAWA
jgi:Gas vesicle synthesis protein GvpL/GvpF